MARKPTQQQREAAKAKRAKMYELAKEVTKLTAEQRAELVNRAGGIVTVEGHRLSGFNTIFLLHQLSEGDAISVVGGFKQWKKAGRQVRKGEHGFSIWFPSVKKDKPEDDEQVEQEYIRMGLGTVFDVTQTDPIEAE